MRPLTINEAYQSITLGRGKRASLIKTSKCRAFELKLAFELKRYFHLKGIFLKDFDKSTHSIVLFWRFYFPKKEIITKTGVIKERRWDNDNLVKVPRDVFFSWLGIDDALVTDSIISKRVGEKFKISLEVKKSRAFYDDVEQLEKSS